MPNAYFSPFANEKIKVLKFQRNFIRTSSSEKFTPLALLIFYFDVKIPLICSQLQLLFTVVISRVLQIYISKIRVYDFFEFSCSREHHNISVRSFILLSVV